MPRKLLFLLFVVIVPILLVSACNLNIPNPNISPTPTPAPTASSTGEINSPAPEPTATRVLPRAVTVCLGQEPNSLYPLGSLNSAARSVLGAIYDGPIDIFTNGYQPVILEKIPSIARVIWLCWILA